VGDVTPQLSVFYVHHREIPQYLTCVVFIKSRHKIMTVITDRINQKGKAIGDFHLSVRSFPLYFFNRLIFELN